MVGPKLINNTEYNWLHISDMFLDRLGVDWKEGRREGNCQVICGRVRSEGFLCRDKLKYRVLMMVDTQTQIT